MVDIVKLRSIYEYIKINPTSGNALKAWASIVRYSLWAKPSDIVETFGSKATDLLGKKDNKPSTKSCERVVIDIKGNHIRVIAKYQFHTKLKKARLYIKWIGTHAQYDELCAKKLQYDIEMFK